MRKIIFDIDSTITDHWKRIRRNTLPQWPGGVIDSKAFTREEVLKDELTPLCSNFMEALLGRGFNISYLTARGWPLAGPITVEQLISLGMPNPDNIYIVKNIQEKIEVLRELKPNYYVDDFMTGQENSVGTFHKEVAKAIESLGIHVLVFRNDWRDILEQIEIYEGRNK